MRQFLLQEVMQQHLSRRKGDIYTYHSETRQEVTIQLPWHLTRKSRAAENMFGELRKMSFVLEIPLLLQLKHIQLLHIISNPTSTKTEDMQTYLHLCMLPSSIHQSVFCTCLKVTNDGHSFLWDGRKIPFRQGLSLSSFSVKFKLYFSLKFPVAKATHGPIKWTKRCSEGNLTLACSISYIRNLQKSASFHLDRARIWVCTLAPQQENL